jgi:CheY-like chemotaxis protein
MLPVVAARYPRMMPELLIATDSPAVFEEVSSAVEEPGVVLRWARSGRAVLPALMERPADLVITDLQIGSMGGFAVVMDLALEAGGGRLPTIPALVMLDRRADVFLCKRTGVAGWLLKPLDSLRISDAVQALLAGGTFYDGTFSPVPADVQLA